MKRLDELKEAIENIEITYNYDRTYADLYNACIDYMNETQNWEFEYIFEDYVDYEIAEDIAKREIEQGGLLRLYYFLGDANPNNDLFKIDGYGNLQNVDKEDLEYIKQEILDKIEEMRGEFKCI